MKASVHSICVQTTLHSHARGEARKIEKACTVATKQLPSPKRFELLRGNPMYLAGTRLNHSAKATTHMPSQGARHARIFQPTGQPHKTGARKNNINNNKKTKLNSSRSHSRCPSERSPSITAPRNEEAGRSSGRLAPAPARGPLAPAAAIALRPESPESSSGLKVLSVLENTDQMYAL